MIFLTVLWIFVKNEVSAAGNLIQIISRSRQNALKKVNEELIQMYWKVGEYLSTESMKTSLEMLI